MSTRAVVTAIQLAFLHPARGRAGVPDADQQGRLRATIVAADTFELDSRFESMDAAVHLVLSKGHERCRATRRDGVSVRVDVDDPAAIAPACADLLSARAEERRRPRAHCRSMVLEGYSWERTANGLVVLYSRLAGDGARA